MLNTLDIEAFAPLFADDRHTSQIELDEMPSKAEFQEYMTKKLKAMWPLKARRFSEMGHVDIRLVPAITSTLQSAESSSPCIKQARTRRLGPPIVILDQLGAVTEEVPR